MEIADRTLVVLFRLKPGTDRDAYEAWARSTDLPIVRQLPSVSGFEVLRATGLLGTEGTPPYDYVELIGIRALDDFGRDVATETMRKVAAEFREFADNPVFMLTSRLD